MTSTTAQQTAATQTDEGLMTLVFWHGGHTPRDAEGRLRELTDEELALGAALRTEAKRRGLL